MAPTTRSRKETRPPPRRKRLTCYVLIDKTQRNRIPEPKKSAAAEDDESKKKPVPAPRSKGLRKATAKATAKRKVTTRARATKEMVEGEEDNDSSLAAVDEQEEQVVAAPAAQRPLGALPEDITTPVRPPKKRVPPPSPLHPPSDSGKPLTIPPAFDAATPTPDPPPTRPPHLTHHRPQMSSLPPSSPPSGSSQGSLTVEPVPPPPLVPEEHEDDPWDPDLHAYEDSENDPANQTFTSIADALGIPADSDQSFHTPTRPRIRHSGGLDAFRTPTRGDFDKSFKTPTRGGDQQSDDNSIAELFAEGIEDDSGEGSINWANQGSDKENLVSSIHADENKENPYDGGEGPQGFPSLHAHRGILQPHAVSSSPAHHPEDDPFGFFEAERRVKERRQLYQHPDFQSSQPEAGPSRPRQPLGRRTFADLNPDTPPRVPPARPGVAPTERFAYLPSSSPAHSHSSLEDLYATPPSQRGFGLVLSTPMRPPRREEQEVRTPVTVRTPLVAVTPTTTVGVMTPRNGERRRDVTMRRHKPKEMAISLSDMEESGPREDSPSPVKRKRVERKDQEQDAEAEEEEEEEERPAKRLKKGKGKENAARTQRRSREKEEDPMAVTKRLERLLPRRPKRAAAKKAKAKVVEEASEDGDEQEEGPSSRSPVKAERGRRRSRGVYGRRARGRGARSAESSRGRRKMDESTPEEIREKREQDRLERSEYFKKLEGYKLRKEKVYVV